MIWEHLISHIVAATPPTPKIRANAHIIETFTLPVYKVVHHLPAIWPRQYYMIDSSQRAMERVRQEQGLSPLDIHYVHDIRQLYGVDKTTAVVVLGPGYRTAPFFNSSGIGQGAQELLQDLSVRFGDTLLLYRCLLDTPQSFHRVFRKEFNDASF